MDTPFPLSPALTGDVKTVRNKGGRPHEPKHPYKITYAKHAYRFALCGWTDDQIAENLEVNTRTLRGWKKAHPEFKAALVRGRKRAIAKTVNRLFEAANGFRYEETSTVTNTTSTVVRMPQLQPDGSTLMVDAEKIETHVRTTRHDRYQLPSVAAQMFYLKNRARSDWYDATPVEGEIGGKDTADLAREIRSAVKAMHSLDQLPLEPLAQKLLTEQGPPVAVQDAQSSAA